MGYSKEFAKIFKPESKTGQVLFSKWTIWTPILILMNT